MRQLFNDIILFVALVLLMSIVAGMIMMSVYDVNNLSEIDVKGYLINGILSQLVMFTGAFVLYLQITKQSVKDVLWLNPLESRWFLLTLVFTAVAFLCIELLAVVNGWLEYLIPNHPAIVSSLEISERQLNILQSLDGIQLLYAVVVIGVLPAIGEELVFRGFLLRKLYDYNLNKQMAIGVSALVFAVVHFQVLNFLPICFMGILLGYVYVQSRNILYPMLIHFLYNGIQVVFAYYTA